ncbi:MAG: hypothetical protein IJ013_09625, partial [Bacteroidaceae bacterium]|nr:hypothetical protein [Bacteroidaceae bacterium]
MLLWTTIKIGFNPRTHEGCDRKYWRGLGAKRVSIHAPTKGATKELYINSYARKGFNPRTHEGCDIIIESEG